VAKGDILVVHLHGRGSIERGKPGAAGEPHGGLGPLHPLLGPLQIPAVGNGLAHDLLLVQAKCLPCHILADIEGFSRPAPHDEGQPHPGQLQVVEGGDGPLLRLREKVRARSSSD